MYSAFAVGDSLDADTGERFDVVLTNPPFGKKSSTTIVGEEGKAMGLMSPQRIQRRDWTGYRH